MRYHISDEPLRLREYGRNIQMMVEYAKGLTDDAHRNALVHEIVRIMSNINPSVREIPEFRTLLWEHLYHIAEYDIEVDAPIPMPEARELNTRPTKPMAYMRDKSRYRQYGRNVDLMVEQALKEEDGPRKDALINLIANIMKMHLKTQERDSNAEVTVMEHLRVLSNGKIRLSPEDITFYKGQPTQNLATSSHKSSGSKKKKKKSNYRK